jgi:lysozyme family protein
VITEERLIDDVFLREGDVYSEPPRNDQPTGRGGITLTVLQECCGPQASLQDLRTLTHQAARDVVRWKLRQIAKVHGLNVITFEPLRLQLVDYAYNSGPGLALRWLQRVLRVQRTSRMDAATIASLQRSDLWLVHHALIAARLQMIDLATDPGGKVDHTFEEGLENRALTFSLLAVP